MTSPLLNPNRQSHTLWRNFNSCPSRFSAYRTRTRDSDIGSGTLAFWNLAPATAPYNEHRNTEHNLQGTI